MSIEIDEVVGGRDKTLQNVITQINTNFANVKSGTDSDVDRIDTKLDSLFGFGVYTGDGITDRVIGLGYRPKAVLVVTSNGQMGGAPNDDIFRLYGGLALDGYAVSYGNNKAEITSNGFTVSGDCNSSNTTYYYIAIKSDSEIVVHS